MFKYGVKTCNQNDVLLTSQNNFHVPVALTKRPFTILEDSTKNVELHNDGYHHICGLQSHLTHKVKNESLLQPE